MKIKISNLSEGIHPFSFDELIGEVGLETPFFGMVAVIGELNKLHNQIVLDAKISVYANFECDRCTTAYKNLIESNYRMVYLFGKEPDKEDALNVTYLSIDADKIILDKDVRDYSMLAIPMKKLCDEDCKGLCYKCGKNLNEGECECSTEDIDIRWQPLLDLKKKLNIS
jgi:uncharacterized protein